MSPVQFVPKSENWHIFYKRHKMAHFYIGHWVTYLLLSRSRMGCLDLYPCLICAKLAKAHFLRDPCFCRDARSVSPVPNFQWKIFTGDMHTATLLSEKEIYEYVDLTFIPSLPAPSILMVLDTNFGAVLWGAPLC